MLVSERQPYVRDDLLSIATMVCERQVVVTLDHSTDTTVWWGNTEFDPGIGLLAYLNQPVSKFGFNTLRAVLITYLPEGESSITVDKAMPTELFENDVTAISFRDTFRKLVGERGEGLVGKGLAMKPSDIPPWRYVQSEELVDWLHDDERVSELYDPRSSETMELDVNAGQSGLILPANYRS